MIHESKRQSERVFTNLPALFDTSDGRVEVATVTDISEQGAFVRTDCPEAPGEIRFFEIVLPDGTLLGVFGLVRFVGRTAAGNGMGVQLLSLSYDEHERWMEHYRGRLPALVSAPLLQRAA